jgi:predicted AAA+ superfamily ATPase
MELLRAKLMSLSVYKNMLETEPVKCLMGLTEAKTPDTLIRSYTDLVYSVLKEGFETLSDCLCWHLKYDESFIGNKIASGDIPEFMLDAAAMDIRRLSSLARLSCTGLKRNIYQVCTQRNPELGPIVQNLAELPVGREFTEEEIFESYRKKGCGQFALGRAFHWEKGNLSQVKHPDALAQDEMIGYEFQRNAVIENTRVLLTGKPTNNVLLYGDSGTGKSATVKSLIHIPEFYNLRLIEIAKNSLDELTNLITLLKGHTQKFIIYIDDLSFEQEDKGFSALKTALEGGLERRPDNVAIYVTSNRRHMIRESFADRQGDDVHARETLEERTSLSERFGLRLSYLALDKQRYTDMVLSMCHQRGLTIPDAQIRLEANRWELQHGSRTPRVACQLVEKLAGLEQL